MQYMEAVVVVHFESVFVKEVSCKSYEIMHTSLHIYKPFHEKSYIIYISSLYAGLFCMLYKHLQIFKIYSLFFFFKKYFSQSVKRFKMR